MAPEQAMVSVSTGAMNSVLSKLATLSQEGVSKAIRREVVFLSDELESMKGLLEKLADTEDHDPLVKGWMRQVREMTYDLEDSVDVFMVSASQSGGGAKPLSLLEKIHKLMNKITLQHQIAKKIQELKQRVQEASERRSRYKLDDAVTSGLHRVPIDPRLHALFPQEVDLVGMDGSREKLMEMLGLGEDKQLKVVPIVGMGGSGKTTLAISVYEKLQLQFDCWAFVSVSSNPNIRVLLRDVLFQVSAEEDASTDEASDELKLVDALRQFLFNKRYLIVIDDIWDASAWRIIECALPQNNLASRILVTTRVMSVAQSCCHHDEGHIFKMGCLTEREARALFFRRIFGSEDVCPTEFVEISNDILRKCDGLPLAINIIASLLANRPRQVEEWRKVRDSLDSSLSTNFGINAVVKIINLGYIDLPFSLKACFLYIGMFPEDHVIDRKRLVRRWIAEGFVTAQRGLDLEEAGESYFNELINRNLVEPVGTQYDGRVGACRVHDLILDFILLKSVEENFVTIYSYSGSTFGLQDKARRLLLDCHHQRDALTPLEVTTSHVRSLTIIGSEEQMPALANFHALRVLDLQISGELKSHYLKDIRRLYLLKYLRLKTAMAVELPEEIGEFRYLETLDLSGAPRSKLPKSIVRLKQLMYLLASDVKLLDGFRSMQSLKEVSCIRIDRTSALQELGNFPALNVLGLKVYEDILASSLPELTTPNLRSLYIEVADGCSLDFLLDWSFPCCYHLLEFQMKSNDYSFPSVPKWMSSLVNLTLLRINIEVVEVEILDILGGLPSLRALILMVLESTASKQELVIIRSNRFQCLTEFNFTCSNSWGMLMFEAGAMRPLQKLRVAFSARRGCMANGFEFIGIENLVSLEHLVVEIKCRDVDAEEVKSVEDIIRNAASNHPNRPKLELRRRLAEQHIEVEDEREITILDEEEKLQNEGNNDVDKAESSTAAN